MLIWNELVARNHRLLMQSFRKRPFSGGPRGASEVTGERKYYAGDIDRRYWRRPRRGRQCAGRETRRTAGLPPGPGGWRCLFADEVLEGFGRFGLIGTDLSDGDGGDVEVFAMDGAAGEAAQHGELAAVGESIGDGALEEALRRRIERSGRSEECVKGRECVEEALLLRGPGERLGVVPTLVALGDGECPMEQIAHVGEDLNGTAAGSAEIGEGGGRILNSACSAVSEGGEGVAEQSALIVHGRNIAHGAAWLRVVAGRAVLIWVLTNRCLLWSF
jgi:hypothetical protein